MSYYTYIMTNHSNSVLYTGVTNNIEKRSFEHKLKSNPKSFTAKYNLYKLLWFEEFNTAIEAIQAEKIIKGWTRIKKLNLIKSINPKFKNLI